MLKAKLTNVFEWKAILTAIGDIVEDAMFIVNDDGITFRGMDPSHVALLNITFPKSSFELLESKTSFFGLKVADFQTVMNSASQGDIVEFDISHDSMMKVKITGSLNMEYNLRLIEKQDVNIPIPKSEYTSKISVAPNTLSKILGNIQNISDFVSIDSNSTKVEFSGKGDSGDAKINLEVGNPELREIKTSEGAISVYSLEYMAKVIRDIGSASKTVNMEYSSQHPMHINFEMPSMAKVEYFLAPRVEV